jgi:hypothetical protein
MKLLTKYAFLLFTGVLTLMGYSILVNSVEHGSHSASEYLRTKMGGSMNSDDFRIITEGYILANITLGGIMFMIGLSFFCFCLYSLSKKF